MQHESTRTQSSTHGSDCAAVNQIGIMANSNQVSCVDWVEVPGTNRRSKPSALGSKTSITRHNTLAETWDLQLAQHDRLAGVGQVDHKQRVCIPRQR